jgi:hypothetical protein
MVIEHDCDGNVADILLDISQKSDICEQGLENSEENMGETLSRCFAKI